MQHKLRKNVRPAIMAACLSVAAICSAGQLTAAYGQESGSQPTSSGLTAAPLLAEAVDHSLAARANGTIASATSRRPGQRSLINGPLALDACLAGGQLPPIGAISPFPISLRLGAELSPRTKFVGGVDVTLSGVHIIPGLQTRIDADAIISANFTGVSTLIPITVDQLYSKGLIAGKRIYLGGGVGAYIGGITRFGGKVFAGADFSSRLGGEVDLHFAGIGPPLVTAQLRIGL